MTDDLPLLWSFRRCPYAMRARLAIKSSGTKIRLREIILRDKPAEFLAASAKGTVPVLVQTDGKVIDESLDVMIWALSQDDPEGWLNIRTKKPEYFDAYMARLDGPFKKDLDRYKYSSRYMCKNGEETQDEEEAQLAIKHRDAGAVFIKELDDILRDQPYLSGKKAGILDYATLPFLRQFRIADETWFDAQNWDSVHPWLQDFLHSDRFAYNMLKYPQWLTTGEEFDF